MKTYNNCRKNFFTKSSMMILHMIACLSCRKWLKLLRLNFSLPSSFRNYEINDLLNPIETIPFSCIRKIQTVVQPGIVGCGVLLHIFSHDVIKMSVIVISSLVGLIN
jgi:hypothetical protein